MGLRLFTGKGRFTASKNESTEGRHPESPKPAQFWFYPNLQAGGSLFTRCWVGVIGDFRFSHAGIY